MAKRGVLQAIWIYLISYGVSLFGGVIVGLFPVLIFRTLASQPWIMIVIFIASFEALRFYPFYTLNRTMFSKWVYLSIYLGLAFIAILFGFWNNFRNMKAFQWLPKSAFSKIFGLVCLIVIQGFLVPFLFYWKIRKRQKKEEEYEFVDEKAESRDTKLVLQERKVGDDPFEQSRKSAKGENPLYANAMESTDPLSDDEPARDPLFDKPKMKKTKSQKHLSEQIVFDERTGTLKRVKSKRKKKEEDEDDEDSMSSGDEEDAEEEVNPPLTTEPGSGILIMAYWMLLGSRILKVIFEYQVNLYFFLGAMPMVLAVFFFERNLEFAFNFQHLIFFVFFLDAFLALLPGGQFVLTGGLKSFTFNSFMMSLVIMALLVVFVFIHKVAALRSADMRTFPKLMFLGQVFKNTFFNMFFVAIPGGFSSPLYWSLLVAQGALIILTNTGAFSALMKSAYRWMKTKITGTRSQIYDDDAEGLYKQQSHAETLILLAYQDCVADNLILCFPTLMALDQAMRLGGLRSDACHVSCSVGEDTGKMGSLALLFIVTWLVKSLCHLTAHKIVAWKMRKQKIMSAITEEGEEISWKLSRKATIMRHVKIHWAYFITVAFFAIQYVCIMMAETEDAGEFMQKSFDVRDFIPNA